MRVSQENKGTALKRKDVLNKKPKHRYFHRRSFAQNHTKVMQYKTPMMLRNKNKNNNNAVFFLFSSLFGFFFLSSRTRTTLTCYGLSSSVAPKQSMNSIKGLSIQPLDRNSPAIALEEYLKNDNGGEGGGKSLFIFGTYAADFNAIEYVQRLRYYLPILEEECGISKFGIVLNCQPDAAIALCDVVDLDIRNKVDVFVDNTGTVGKDWGVNQGWLPDNKDINPYLKLFGMLWGFGAYATLPAVIGGYLGNPFKAQRWIEDALAVGQTKDRWPNTALILRTTNEDDNNGVKRGTTIIELNKFTELPVVGKWPRRPLELATLRLQSMMGISLKDWKKLAPDEDALQAGVLTQLGGCIVVDNATLQPLFEWKDPGICAVANFEDMITQLKQK